MKSGTRHLTTCAFALAILIANNVISAGPSTYPRHSRGDAVDTQTTGTVANEGVIVDSDTSTTTDPLGFGYGKPNQTRVWYNSYQDRWDALVPKFDPEDTDSGSDHYIVKDVNGAQAFTDLEVEHRNTARPDVFWDDGGKRLYVLSSHFASPGFSQLIYSEGTDTYAFNPDVDHVTVPGLTHPVGDGENVPATLYVSPNRKIWAAIMKDDELLVQYSANGGADWEASPIVLDTEVLVGVTGWTHFDYDGRTWVGLFATENGEAGIVPTKYFYWYIDQHADPRVSGNWFNDTDAIPGSFGLETSDDHLRVSRDDDSNQYFVVKTEGGDPEDPQIKLFKRTPSGVWSQYRVTEVQDVPEQSRPTMAIDSQSSEIHIYTSPTGGGAAELRTAPLDDLGQLETAPVTSVFTTPDRAFDDISAPRRTVDASTDLVLLAHSEADKTVWYSEIAIDESVPCSATGGTPESMLYSIPQADGVAGMLEALIVRPDPSLQDRPCPLISVVPKLYSGISAIQWAAERLARDGYVVIVTDPAQETFESFDRAARSGIDFMLSAENPWLDATDTSRIGLLGGSVGSHALTRTQESDTRVDALVALDNLSKTGSGDQGSPTCQWWAFDTRRTPKVPALGLTSDRCFRRRDVKKTAFFWWRAYGVETMEVVFANSNYQWFGPGGSDAQHERVYYYTLAWFDRFVKGDESATERLVARQVLGAPLSSLLDGWYKSAAFLDGYNCNNFRSSCPGPLD